METNLLGGKITFFKTKKKHSLKLFTTTGVLVRHYL